jgi:hypothetical protein
MHDPRFIALMDGIVALLVALDLVRVLKSGRARIWLGGTVTREHQPKPYWRYVHLGYGALVFCAVVLIWAAFWPDSLR